MKFTDALRDRAAARMILDPADPKYVTGSEEERKEARQAWYRQRFTAQVMSRDDLEEIPRANLHPLRGPRLLEDTATGAFYVPRRDGLIDLDYIPDAVAYYVDPAGTPVLLERPTGGAKSRAELEQRRAERERRRNAPRPRRQVKRP